MKPLELGLILLIFAGSAMPQSVKHEPGIPDLPASPKFSVSTKPPNGDLNPYGVAFVPRNCATGGSLNPGDIIVSSFNDRANVQGTGTTIVRVAPDGQASLFFEGPSGSLGLTTALGVLSAGFVIVGNVPTDVNGVPQPGLGGEITAAQIPDGFVNLLRN